MDSAKNQAYNFGYKYPVAKSKARVESLGMRPNEILTCVLCLVVSARSKAGQ
jgi:hypothetical protein